MTGMPSAEALASIFREIQPAPLEREAMAHRPILKQSERSLTSSPAGGLSWEGAAAQTCTWLRQPRSKRLGAAAQALPMHMGALHGEAHSRPRRLPTRP